MAGRASSRFKRWFWRPAEDHMVSSRPRHGVAAGRAVATGLLALTLIERALADAARLFSVFQPLGMATTAGAVAVLIVGWTQPAPWVLATLLVTILGILWSSAVSRFLRIGAWGEP